MPPGTAPTACVVPAAGLGGGRAVTPALWRRRPGRSAAGSSAPTAPARPRWWRPRSPGDDPRAGRETRRPGGGGGGAAGGRPGRAAPAAGHRQGSCGSGVPSSSSATPTAADNAGSLRPGRLVPHRGPGHARRRGVARVVGPHRGTSSSGAARTCRPGEVERALEAHPAGGPGGGGAVPRRGDGGAGGGGGGGAGHVRRGGLPAGGSPPGPGALQGPRAPGAPGRRCPPCRRARPTGPGCAGGGGGAAPS